MKCNFKIPKKCTNTNQEHKIEIQSIEGTQYKEVIKSFIACNNVLKI